jgi:hypothetical protein
VDASWWKGRLAGRKDDEAGLFPSNYVEKIQSNAASSSSTTLPSLPARNMPPIYTPSIHSDHSSSTYHDNTQDQSKQGSMCMPSPYGQMPSSNWSNGAPPAMPPPPPSNGYTSPHNYSQNSFMTAPQQSGPPNHYVSPQPSGNYISPVTPPEKQGLSKVPSNNPGYWQQQHPDQAAAVGPSNPALYGAPQPAPGPTPEEKAKHDKVSIASD